MDPVAAVIVLLVAGAAAWERRRDRDDRAAERKAWEAERHALITRILRPELIPTPAGKAPRDPDPRIGEARVAYARVGVAAPYDPDAAEGDD